MVDDAQITKQINDLSLVVTHEPDYVAVFGYGSANLRDFYLAIDVTAVAAATHANTRVLIDLLAVRQSLSYAEHLMLGARVAERLAFAERVATIVPEQYRSGASERAAQKSGLGLHAFTRREDAIAWLVQPAGD
jgi:hypothetical protein